MANQTRHWVATRGQGWQGGRGSTVRQQQQQMTLCSQNSCLERPNASRPATCTTKGRKRGEDEYFLMENVRNNTPAKKGATAYKRTAINSRHLDYQPPH